MKGKSEDRDHRRAAGPAPDAVLDAKSEATVLRWLTGEMDAGEARAFEERLAADPALARAAAARRRTWRRLEVPDSAPGEGVPPGFSGRVMAQVLSEAGRSEAGRDEAQRTAAGRGPLSAAWSRAAGAAALAGGLALGLGLAQVAGLSGAAGPATVVGTVEGVGDDSASGDPITLEPVTLSYAYGDLYSGLAAGSAEAPGGGGDSSGDSVGAFSGDDAGGTLAADYAAALGELAGGEGT